MYRFVIILYFLNIGFQLGYGQLNTGMIAAAVPAMQAGNTVLNALPPQTRDCVNKITTKAVTDSLVTKLASSAGPLLGNINPQITRDPGTVECKKNSQGVDTPYYKETSHLKANVFNLPIDFPVTTESDLTTCLQGPLNFCTTANSLFGNGAGQFLNQLTGANKPAPQAQIGAPGSNPLSSIFSGRR